MHWPRRVYHHPHAQRWFNLQPYCCCHWTLSWCSVVFYVVGGGVRWTKASWCASKIEFSCDSIDGTSNTKWIFQIMRASWQVCSYGVNTSCFTDSSAEHLKWERMENVLHLTPIHKSARLDWARKMLLKVASYWHLTMFSDENISRWMALMGWRCTCVRRCFPVFSALPSKSNVVKLVYLNFTS